MAKTILAVNPWIVDCAAYDFWVKPYGFLVILTALKQQGFTIDYIDCLDAKETHAHFGRGKYPSQEIPKPPGMKALPREFRRYGISVDTFTEKLHHITPDFILLTSSMTYWYPGVKQAAAILKDRFPQTPLILGGTYATLCQDHAREEIPCDRVIASNRLGELFSLLGADYDYDRLYTTLPDYAGFYPHLEYIPFRTSWGCPFTCSYCAIKRLFPSFIRVPVNAATEFIIRYANSGIQDFALYDDAFLYQPAYAKEFLQRIAEADLKVRFHTPNALHLTFLDQEIACLLKDSGFWNPHFGLETLNPTLQKEWGGKVTRDDVIRGIEYLQKAGFNEGEFSMYLLLGYPNQNLDELKKDVDFLHSLGAKVSLAEFSPVPGTKVFLRYAQKYADPLLQNNSIFGLLQEENIQAIWDIKNYVRGLNKTFTASSNH